jgi:hypothetical protein
MISTSVPVPETKSLTPARASSIIPASEPLPAFFRLYLEARYNSLMREVNEVMRMLGKNPKRCPHCHEELK